MVAIKSIFLLEILLIPSNLSRDFPSTFLVALSDQYLLSNGTLLGNQAKQSSF